MTKLLYSDTKRTLIYFLKKICGVILYLACWGEGLDQEPLPISLKNNYEPKQNYDKNKSHDQEPYSYKTMAIKWRNLITFV